MNRPSTASRSRPAAARASQLSASQRAGLHAAAVHGEGHIPACLPANEARQLAELGLIEALGACLDPRFGPLTRAPSYRITRAGRSRARREPLPQVLLVPCSMGKAEAPAAPAGEMYVGPYHVAARKAAAAAAADGSAQVLTLSAKFGLLRDEDRILHYDLRAGQNGTVSAYVLARQARFLGVSAARVTVFAGRSYADLAATIWPTLEHPLRGLGIGQQLAFFADLYRPSRRSGLPCP
ncbi:DUF6884 domain-containing protein [Streptomyces violascens]|uniref:DUF6884 domain-containing protein n=1 Tax=Streptomyces violascens TaxID=67381 RepID=UPI001675D393|nr:DUF6884 domain-containing protein [Streptomyces violascens]GGU49461.1 hypothetical protein GCM10010289_82480 [Streptomyces violascens]